MNIQTVKEYIEAYKENFERISNDELYKWKAVKQFQDSWDIEAEDFGSMMERSLKGVKNLMASGQYFPKRMLLKNIYKDHLGIRKLFNHLYDQDISFIERVNYFRNNFEKINSQNFPDDNSYQDQRAVMVYLSLRYPEDYFFFKYKMFERFVDLVNYDYKLKGNKDENLIEFHNVCVQLRELLIKDNELLKLHHNRLDDSYYQDPEYHLLTQDFIYACVRHLGNITTSEMVSLGYDVSFGELSSNENNTEIPLEGVFVDYGKRQKRNAILGMQGEKFILKYEKDRLREDKINDIDDKVLHISVSKGDGLGYDIESVDDNGQKTYIEVKTTKGNLNSPFFVTRNELLRSMKDAKQFRLYRVYDFNEDKQVGKIKIYKGSLECVCNYPVNYHVKLI